MGLKQIAKNWRFLLALSSIIISIIFSVGMSEFMFEEAAQAATPYICKDAIRFANAEGDVMENLELCLSAYERQQEIVNMGKGFTAALGWINPLNYEAYKAVWRGYESQISLNKILLPRVAENTVSYLKSQDPMTKPIRMCDNYTYTYAVMQFNEKDVKGQRTYLEQATTEGWYIKDSYQTKIRNDWYIIYIMCRIDITSIPCVTQY